MAPPKRRWLPPSDCGCCCCLSRLRKQWGRLCCRYKADMKEKIRRRRERRRNKREKFEKKWGEREIGLFTLLRRRPKPRVSGFKPRYDWIPKDSVLRKRKPVIPLRSPNFSFQRPTNFRASLHRMVGLPFYYYYPNKRSWPTVDIQYDIHMAHLIAVSHFKKMQGT